MVVDLTVGLSYPKAIYKSEFADHGIANELRALEQLPLGKEADLWDTSATGRRIYYLLRTSEDTRDVSLLDEAGRLRWEQIYRPPCFRGGPLPQQEVSKLSAVSNTDLEGRGQQPMAIQESRIPVLKILVRCSSRGR